MNRNEACALLSMIAQNELIDMQVSREILKARDIVVCEPHRILDVLASPETKDLYKTQLISYIDTMIDNGSIFSFEIRQKLYTLKNDIENGFKDYVCCTEKYLEDRCKDCPKYWAHAEHKEPEIGFND